MTPSAKEKTMAEHNLINIDTNETIRAATQEEHEASLSAAKMDNGVGAISVDGVTCYVD